MLDLYLNTEDKDNPLFILIKVFSFFSVLLFGMTGEDCGFERFFSVGFLGEEWRGMMCYF